MRVKIISCSLTTSLADCKNQEVMHRPTWLLTHCPAATDPPMDSGLAARAEVEPGNGGGVCEVPRGHGWARIRRGLVTDGRRGGLKCPNRHN